MSVIDIEMCNHMCNETKKYSNDLYGCDCFTNPFSTNLQKLKVIFSFEKCFTPRLYRYIFPSSQYITSRYNMYLHPFFFRITPDYTVSPEIN